MGWKLMGAHGWTLMAWKLMAWKPMAGSSWRGSKPARYGNLKSARFPPRWRVLSTSSPASHSPEITPTTYTLERWRLRALLLARRLTDSSHPWHEHASMETLRLDKRYNQAWVPTRTGLKIWDLTNFQPGRRGLDTTNAISRRPKMRRKHTL